MERHGENEPDRFGDGRDHGCWPPDDAVVAVGDRHDRGVETLCVGEAA
jgi:hypothetical protein